MKPFLLLLCFALMALARAGSGPSRLPLSFEKNQGQTDSEVVFLTHSPQLNVFFGAHKVTFAGASGPMALSFAGSSTKVFVRGVERQPGIVNYLLGQDQRNWRSRVPTYGRVSYEGLYPGVELVFYGNSRQLEYDFVLQPNADPSRIVIKWGNQPQGSRIDSSGDLIVSDQLRFRKPHAYQLRGGFRNPVAAAYRVRPDGGIAFRLGDYDRTKPLVIDPILTYSSYVGGGDDEGIFGIEHDSVGNIYIAGETSSLNFPVLHPVQPKPGGSYDAFVSKFDPTGTRLIYSTYLGGSNYDHCVGIGIDAAGNAFVAGITDSVDFPVVNAVQPVPGGSYDGFVAGLDPSGSRLLFSTYLGGMSSDNANGIALDRAGDIYVAGYTASLNFPVTGDALQPVCDRGYVPGFCFGDAFVSKFTRAGTLIYSTYLGGNGFDLANAIAVDAAGRAYVSGSTSSTNFPVRNAFQSSLAGQTNGFVTKLNAAGSQISYSTYLGGGGSDFAQGIAVDTAGAVYVTGTTTSTNFPLQNPVQPANKGGMSDGFVSKFAPDGASLVYSSYLGGSGWDFPFRIAVDPLGDAVVAGFTSSLDFPMARAFQPAYGGGNTDGFVTEFSATGTSLLFSTYLGGAGDEYGYAEFADWAGNIWTGGSTSSTNFPIRKPFQGVYNGGPFDAYLTAFAATPGMSLNILNAAVANLVTAGTLTPAQAAPLHAELAAAQSALALGDTSGAESQVRAFLTSVNQLIASGGIPARDGYTLITAGTDILKRI